MLEIRQTTVFAAWLDALAGDRAYTKVLSRISNMEDGNFGDWKPVGEGVMESRIDHGPGYRIYYTRVGDTVYLLLHGGDKSAQAKDIKRAKALAAGLGRRTTGVML